MDSVELKPCPFCGGKPSLVADDSYGACQIYCGCEMASISDAKENLSQAVAKWNRRLAVDGGAGGIDHEWMKPARHVGETRPYDLSAFAVPQDASIRKDEGGTVEADSLRVEPATSPVTTPAGTAPRALPHPAPDNEVRVPQVTKMQDGQPAGPFDSKAAYFELIMAVGNAYPGETRHQTALRYIQQAERGSNEPAQSAKQRGGG